MRWRLWVGLAACLLALDGAGAGVPARESMTPNRLVHLPHATDAGAPRAVPVQEQEERGPAWAVGFGKEFWRQPMADSQGKPSRGAMGAVAPAAIRLEDVIERVSHALSTTTGDPFPRVRANSYGARFDPVGLRFSIHGLPDAGAVLAEARFRTKSIRRGEQQLYAAEAIAPEWFVAGNTVQALLNTDCQIVEHYEARRDGVAVTWVLGRPLPGTGSLWVEAVLDGMVHSGENSNGHQFMGPAGEARLRFGTVTAVDSAGHQWKIPVQAHAASSGTIRIEVPTGILNQASYPLAIDPLLSPEFEVGSTCLPAGAMPGDQYQPAVAFNGTVYLVVWQDNRQWELTGTDIHGARVDRNGVILDPCGFVICGANGNQSAPAVAGSAGRFLVVWEDERHATEFFGVAPDIYGAFVDAGFVSLANFDVSGIIQFIPGEGSVLQPAPGPQRAPAVAAHGDDFFVVWESSNSGPSLPTAGVDLYGVRVASAPTPGVIRPPSRISAGSGDELAPAIAANASGYFVAWEDTRNSAATGHDIYGAVVNPAGTVSPEQVLSTAVALVLVRPAPQDQSLPAVASNGADFLVAWRDARKSDVITKESIYATRVSAAGAVLDANGIPISISIFSDHPAVAADPCGYVVAWDESANGVGGDRIIRGTRVDPAGLVLNAFNFGLSTSLGHERSPAVAAGAPGQLFIACEGVRNGANRVEASFLATPARCGQTIPGLFHTGVDDNGAPLADGAVDPHYRLIQSADPAFPGPNAAVVNAGWPVRPAGPWLANGANSKWIAPQPAQLTGNPPGDYTYELRFELSGLDPGSAAILGQWATDNTSVDILLNDVSQVVPASAGFGVWTPFQIAGGFRAGMNTLKFHIRNAGTDINPTGLRVEMAGVALPARPPGSLDHFAQLGRNRVGSCVFNGETAAGESYSVVGGGNDIWDNHDEMTFCYTELCGDFDVKVRVESVTANARWSKAGLMVRESLAEDSRMLFQRVTPAAVPICADAAVLGANDVRFSYRTGKHINDASGDGDRFNDDINDGRHEEGAGTPAYPNAWIRLVRTGKVFSGYTSADGVSWILSGTQDTGAGNWIHLPEMRPISDKILLGLAVSRHSGPVPSCGTAQAEFRDFKLTLDPRFCLGAADSKGCQNQIRLCFTDPVGMGAFNAGNYTVNNGIFVLGASAGPTPETVNLTVNPMTEGTVYTVTVVGSVNDAGGNPIDPGCASASFRHLDGYEARQVHVLYNQAPAGWDPSYNAALPGYYFQTLAYQLGLPVATGGQPAHHTNPTFFEDGPTAIADNDSRETFVSRILGVVEVIADGDYRFACSSDDGGALFLSTDDKPAHKVEIAREPAWATTREWTGNAPGAGGRGSCVGSYCENVSAPIRLRAGQRYYLEYVAAEGGGGNHAAVVWDAGTGAFPANGTTPLATNPADPLWQGKGRLIPSRWYRNEIFYTLGAAFITEQPQPRTARIGTNVCFSVGVDGAPPYEFQWKKNGVPIPGATARDYCFPVASAADGGCYSVCVSNAWGGAISSDACLTVLERPRLTSCTSRGNCHAFYVEYDKPMQLVARNYSLVCSNTVSGLITPLTLTGIQYGRASNEFCVFVAEELLPDTNVYCVTVWDAASVDGLVTDPNPTTCCFTHGAEYPRTSVVFERYDDVGNGDLAAFLSSPKFLNHQPDVVIADPTGFFESPTDIRDNYGGRIFGYWVAPATGNYYFWMSSDDQGVTYIATDANPARKVQICSEPAWAGVRAWADARHDNNDNRGNPPVNGSIAAYPNGIPLTAGQKVYLEGLFTEAMGGDNYALTVRMNDPAVPSNGALPIPVDQFARIRISPDGTTFSALCDVFCNPGPSDQSVVAGQPATFSVTPDGTPPHTFQWEKNGVPIPGANGASYTESAVTTTDDGAVYTVVVGNAFSSNRCTAVLHVTNSIPSPACLVVTTTADSGTGSLRAAIECANQRPGFDRITFAIPGAGPHTIRPLSPLPAITDPVEIDGYSQPGASPNSRAAGNDANLQIGLNGATSTSLAGLRLETSRSLIRGLVIQQFIENGGPQTGCGICVAGGHNRIEGCFLGTDFTGTVRRGNDRGVVVQGNSGNTVGGPDPAQRNLISGNNLIGVLIHSGSMSNRIHGNYIGTDGDGANQLGNGHWGVIIDGLSTLNAVGGDAPGMGNLIAGSSYNVYLNGSENVVQGNRIGTDKTGTHSLSIGSAGASTGIFLAQGNNVVGGALPGAGNLISGNAWGVVAQGSGHRIQANRIGTDETGLGDLANIFGGILLRGRQTFVGGSANGEGNRIAFNRGPGVLVVDGGSVRNQISANSIFSNHGLGIDLTSSSSDSVTGDGVTFNDQDDADSGPNRLQNFPVLTSARLGGGNVVLEGNLNSRPNGNYRIEFFANTAPDPSGYGEGEVFLGSTNVTTDAAGVGRFVGILPAVGGKAFYTATATDSDGNTSEFSPATGLTSGAAVPCLWNTGVDASGNVLPDDAPEQHYQLVQGGPATGTPFVARASGGFPIPPWLGDNAQSAWIAPATNTQAGGATDGSAVYRYETVFDLTGFDPSSVVISGRWSTDNGGRDIQINGTSTGQPNTAQFGAWTPFHIRSGFVAGVNRLRFLVSNGEGEANPFGPTGLRVEMSGTGTLNQRLFIERRGVQVVLSWLGSGFLLQAAETVTGPWTDFGIGTTLDGVRFELTVPPDGRMRFFRLRTILSCLSSSAAADLLRARRVVPGDLDNPPVPEPTLVWFNPTDTLGGHGTAQLAWKFHFEGDRSSDVIVSADGGQVLDVIHFGPETPYTHRTTPRFRLDSVTGVPRFVAFNPPLSLPSASGSDAVRIAYEYFETFPWMFGTGNPSNQLRLARIDTDSMGGRQVVFNQFHGGLSVWGCQLRVHVDKRWAITSIAGRYYREPDVDLTPSVGQTEAFGSAVQHWMGANGGDHLEPDERIVQRGLVILPARLGDRSARNDLVWWFSFPDADRFVSASTGTNITAYSRHYHLRQVIDMNQKSRFEDEGELQLENSVQVVTGSLDPEATSADKAMIAVQSFWRSVGRDVWAGDGNAIKARVDADPRIPPFVRLSFDVGAVDLGGGLDDPRFISVGYFPRDFATTDAMDNVAHEFCHSMIVREAQLIYAFEPGALNESFADVFAKLIIPTPMPWILGVNLPQNVRRDLGNPSVANYANYVIRPNTLEEDFGAVHQNSGIGNRAAVLLAGRIGRPQMAKIWWETVQRLSPWSTYIDMVANAWDVTQDLAAEGAAGMDQVPHLEIPNEFIAPRPLTQSDALEVLWAFREVGLDLRLQSGWFSVPTDETAVHVFFPGAYTECPQRTVEDVIVRIGRRPSNKGNGTGFLGELKVSNGTISQAFGPVTATIIWHGVGTTSREVHVRTTTENFADVDVNVHTPLTGTCGGGTPEPVPLVTPRVVHWYDNPFFAGRKYDDMIYGCTSSGQSPPGWELPPGCLITDVQLELLDANNQPLVPRKVTRWGEAQARHGGTGAGISAPPALGRDLRVKVHAWHDFGWSVRYRLIYFISGDNCSLPPFSFCDGGDIYGFGVGFAGD